jgi:hypothetical protein
MATKRSQEATHEQHRSAAHGRKVIWHFTSVAGWVRGGADHELDCVTGAWCETLHSQPASNARTHPYPGCWLPKSLIANASWPRRRVQSRRRRARCADTSQSWRCWRGQAAPLRPADLPRPRAAMTHGRGAGRASARESPSRRTAAPASTPASETSLAECVHQSFGLEVLGVRPSQLPGGVHGRSRQSPCSAGTGTGRLSSRSGCHAGTAGPYRLAW